MPESPERVVLWRLLGYEPGKTIMCVVQPAAPDGFTLRVERDGEIYLSERYGDELRLIERSRELRQVLVDKGWTDAEMVNEA